MTAPYVLVNPDVVFVGMAATLLGWWVISSVVTTSGRRTCHVVFVVTAIGLTWFWLAHRVEMLALIASGTLGTK